MSRWLSLPLAALVLLAAATAPAAAKPVTVTIGDRAGDAPDPQLDVRGAALRYDRGAGLLNGVLALGAAPTSQVIEGATIYLGRYTVGGGNCVPSHEATITVPTPEDVANGFPWPFTELYTLDGTKAIGFLPSVTRDGSISFTSVGADPAVVAAVKRGRFTCATVWSFAANGSKVADETAELPLLNGPRPRCRVGTKRIAGGKRVPIRCKRAGRRVTVRLYKRGSRTYFTGRERVRRGRLSVPTTPSMRGTWRITLWKGDAVIATFDRIKVR